MSSVILYLTVNFCGKVDRCAGQTLEVCPIGQRHDDHLVWKTGNETRHIGFCGTGINHGVARLTHYLNTRTIATEHDFTRDRRA